MYPPISTNGSISYLAASSEAKLPSSDNLFYYLTYEGAIDLDPLMIRGGCMRFALKYLAGQTPKQLFSSAHPSRNDAPAVPSALREAALAPDSPDITSVPIKRLDEIDVLAGTRAQDAAIGRASNGMQNEMAVHSDESTSGQRKADEGQP